MAHDCSHIKWRSLNGCFWLASFLMIQEDFWTHMYTQLRLACSLVWTHHHPLEILFNFNLSFNSFGLCNLPLPYKSQMTNLIISTFFDSLPKECPTHYHTLTSNLHLFYIMYSVAMYFNVTTFTQPVNHILSCCEISTAKTVAWWVKKLQQFYWQATIYLAKTTKIVLNSYTQNH